SRGSSDCRPKKIVLPLVEVVKDLSKSNVRLSTPHDGGSALLSQGRLEQLGDFLKRRNPVMVTAAKHCELRILDLRSINCLEPLHELGCIVGRLALVACRNQHYGL